jgi:hypothetical protein
MDINGKITPRPLYRHEKTPVVIEWEAGWSPITRSGPFWRKENLFTCPYSNPGPSSATGEIRKTFITISKSVCLKNYSHVQLKALRFSTCPLHQNNDTHL